MTERAAAQPVEFVGVIEGGTGGGAWVPLPGEVLEALGGGHRFRVIGTANGVRLESSTMSRGAGSVVVGLHKATRVGAGVDIGDRVTLRLSRDDRPREVVVPEDLAAALSTNASAKAVFDGLAFTHRKEYVEWIESAKRPETRTRRVQQTVERLHPS